jgi:hypothetical protein
MGSDDDPVRSAAGRYTGLSGDFAADYGTLVPDHNFDGTGGSVTGGFGYFQDTHPFDGRGGSYTGAHGDFTLLVGQSIVTKNNYRIIVTSAGVTISRAAYVGGPQRPLVLPILLNDARDLSEELEKIAT